MDPEDLRSLLRDSGVDLWTLIDAAVSVAARDYSEELKARRDGIVERLYGSGSPLQRCRNCDLAGDHCDRAEIGGKGRAQSNGREEEEEEEEEKGSSSPVGKSGTSRSPPTPQSMTREEQVVEEEEEEEEEGDRRSNGPPIDDEKSKILAIKDFLDDQDQPEDSLVTLLQNLADMDITFKALKETDIGRHVNGLRKHPSGEVRRLVKHLVRKWKETVDNWVKYNSACENSSPANITDGDSPLQITGKSNGHLVPDFGYSPNPHNGSSEHLESHGKIVARRESPPKQSLSTPSSAPPAKLKEQKNSLLDPERLASARRRLHENYQEAQNAKKQRTIQVMDINEIPKPKNSFMARNKGGSRR